MNTTCTNPFSELKFLAVLLAAGLVLWGCDQGLTETGEMQSSAPETSAMPDGAVSAATANQQPDLSGKAKTTNEQLRSVSRAVAKALAEDDVRRYLHERVLERFDGETNVLWTQLNERQDRTLPQAMQQADGKPWTSVAKSKLAPEARSLAPKLDDIIDRAGKLLGGPVHLYWAFAENFDADSRAPLVTFTPLGVDADKITDVVAYDASGQTHVVDEATAEKRPVVVLTANELTDEDGELYPNVIPPPPPCNDPQMNCPGGGGDTPPTKDLPARENGDTEYIYAAKATYCPEGWPNGDCEYYFEILEEDNDPIDDIPLDYTSPYSLSADALDSIGEWIYLNIDVFFWEMSDEGDHVVVSWFERDNQFGDGGPDPMGTQSVNFDDPSDTVYCEDDCGIEWTHRWE